MKKTLCGSIAFYDEMLEIKQKLEQLGHEIRLPPTEVEDNHGKMIPVKEYYALRKKETDENSWVWDRKTEAIRMHFEKIAWSDAILVTNYTKNEIQNYIGANTLLEMGVAFHLNKKIFLLKNIPTLSYTEEILGMKPIIVNDVLSNLH